MAEHWNAACGVRLVPAFRDIDPVAIGRNLRHVWAWRYDRATDSFTGQLAGEEVDKAFGKSLRRWNMAEFYVADVGRVVFPRHRRVVVARGIMHARGMIFASMGCALVGKRIAMPLAENGLQGDGIIGGTIYGAAVETDDASQAVRFGEEKVDFYPLGPAS